MKEGVTLNIKRIIKQVLKEQQEKGTYIEVFNEDANEVIRSQMDKIAKIALENPDIEEQLIYAAEDCIRVHFLRTDYILEDPNQKEIADHDLDNNQ